MSARSRRILVGVDGSDAAMRALDAAVQLTGYGSTLTVVNVASDGERPGSALSDARRRVHGRHVTASYLQRVGDAAGELLDAASELDAELVVVGRRHADRAVGAPAAGSVSATVAECARCDVLLVS